MSTVIDSLEQSVIKERPNFSAGDRVRVHFQVVEGERRRTQVFEGIVLKRQGSGARETFTVRKHSFGVGVERTFPLHSPKVEKLEVAARGDVRRAKLYYLREKIGRRARVAERRWGIEDELILAPEEAEAVDAEGATAEEVEPEASPADPEAEEQEEQAEGEGDGESKEAPKEVDAPAAGGEDKAPAEESAAGEDASSDGEAGEEKT
jgi:large subunit ribosomal protein L19